MAWHDALTKKHQLRGKKSKGRETSGSSRTDKSGSRSKYKNEKVEHAGIWFHSKLEASVYGVLLWMQRAGEISDIKCQVQVKLTEAEILYVADFSFINCATGLTEWVEAKGLEKPEWRIKRRLWAGGYGPGPLHVYKGTYQNPVLFETLIPRSSPYNATYNRQAK